MRRLSLLWIALALGAVLYWLSRENPGKDAPQRAVPAGAAAEAAAAPLETQEAGAARVNVSLSAAGTDVSPSPEPPHGLVLDLDGAPVAGATVYLSGRRHGDSAGDGRFPLPELAPGAEGVALTVAAPGCRVATQRWKGGDALIRLRPGASTQWSAWRRSASDGSWEPAPGAEIRVSLAGFAASDPVFWSGVAGAGGRIFMPEISRKTTLYAVGRLAGFPDVEVRTLPFWPIQDGPECLPSSHRELAIYFQPGPQKQAEPGEPPARGEAGSVTPVAPPAGEAPPDVLPVFRLRGTLRIDGRPYAGATLHWRAVEDSGARGEATVHSEAGGAFQVGPLRAAGAYDCFVTVTDHPGYWTPGASGWRARCPGGTERMDLDFYSGEARLQLAPEVRSELNFLALKEQGEGHAGELRPMDNFTDPLAFRLPPGRYLLSGRGSHLRLPEIAFEVVAGGSVALDGAVEPTGSFSISVFLLGHSRSEVEIELAPGADVPAGVSDRPYQRSHQFATEYYLHPGTWKATIKLAGRDGGASWSWSGELRIYAAERLALDFALDESGTLQVREEKRLPFPVWE